MNVWLDSRIRARPGLLWCAAWLGSLAITCLIASVFARGGFSAVWLLLLASLHMYASLALLRGLKPGWHMAAFLAFAMIVTRGVATACAPGAIARGDMHLFEAALDVLLLAIGVVVFGYLRKPGIRRLYGVPVSYRQEPEAP